MTSTSQSSTSTITVYLRQNYDTSKAAAEINIKVNSVLNQLPSGALQPTITVRIGQTIDAMYFAFNSTTLAANQITDYLTRVAQPILQAVPGVQTAEVLGGQTFSLRAWLDPKKLAAYGLTSSDVSSALAANDYISAVGNTKGQMIQVTLTSTTNLHALEEFSQSRRQAGERRQHSIERCGRRHPRRRQLRGAGRLQRPNRGVHRHPDRPHRESADRHQGRAETSFPEIQAQLPQGLNARIAYDSTDFVNSSIHEVALTLVEALIIVMLVIFAFLGSPRSVLIPVVAIPLSLVGTLAIMLALGFSINLLTLLALVLAIGLVVDDAIIVVENVNRHLEGGTPPLAAAMQAARELGTPIIAMTVVLLAVYIPIGFQGGLTGALFTEFVFTRRGRGDRVGDHRADALAHDVLEAAQAASRGPQGLGERASSGSSTRASSRVRGWYQHRLEQQPELHARDRGVRGPRADQHRASVSQRQERARAARGSRLHGDAIDLRARCDAAAKASVRDRGVRNLESSKRGAGYLSDRGARASRSTATSSAPIAAAAGDRMKSSAACSRNSTRWPAQKIVAFQPPSLPGAFGLPGAVRHQDHRARAAIERGLAGVSR